MISGLPGSVDVDLWGCAATGEVSVTATYTLTPQFPLVGNTSNGSCTYSWRFTNLQQRLDTPDGQRTFTSPFTCRAPMPESWQNSGWLCTGGTLMDRERTWSCTSEHFVDQVVRGHFGLNFYFVAPPSSTAEEVHP